jgi:glucosylglycerate phosphorylase
MPNPELRIRELLTFLYGPSRADEIWPQLKKNMAAFRASEPARGRIHTQDTPWSERDTILITYADQFSSSGQTPLQTLSHFLNKYLGDAISGVHLLPFYPYTSDDGFSVVNYREVDARMGTWEDISPLNDNYRLMFDAVINHISRQSGWFQGYLRGEEPYTDYFIEVSPETDLSEVTRPRALPLLTPVEEVHGTKYVWTTFSDDQIDLNYTNPQVLLEMIDLLLFYVSHGAEFIRLDAIGYLWKEIGTTCIHLPKTHAVVKLWRAILDAVAPDVILITETNVPHKENISYFGDGTDEAQLVYQFPLAPLILHAFHTGEAGKLSEWAATLEAPSVQTTFFNFIASHDGIGVRPAEGLLAPDEISALADRTLAHGGTVSYRNHPDGSRSVYELNITLFDLLNDPANPDLKTDVRRFLASQAIMLSLAGVPGIYVHSFFGSRNCLTCLEETGRARTINREKFQLAELEEQLADQNQHYAQVLDGMVRLLNVRRENPSFHPNAVQRVLALDKQVFAVLRGKEGESETVLCLSNVSPFPVRVMFSASLRAGWDAVVHDLISGGRFKPFQGEYSIELRAYQTVWLW